MRRRVMTAFMCAIMTMSVIPVNADDTQVAKAQQEMESTVKTETTTEMSTQSTTKTEKKKTSRKKKAKITKKKISKDKNGKKSDNEEKVVPMPTQVISKSSTQAMERRISSKQAKIAKLRKEKAKIFKQMKLEAKKEETLKTFYEKYTANSKAEIALYFNPNNVSLLSHITVDDAKQMLKGTALYADAKAYVKAEEKYHVNAVFLMGIAAHESAWGTSRRAREDNNLTGYGVTSDSAKGINKATKEEGLLTTAKTLHEKYLTAGGSYYAGTSAEDVNKHYCVGGEWAAAVVNDAYQLMNQL